MSDRSRILMKLRQVLGPQGLLDDAAACHVYSRDASHLHLGKPWAVALPRTALQVQQVVDLCRQAGIPLVCRGTGTGLSGGAVPADGSLVLSTSRMESIGPIDARHFTVTVQPGVLNTAVTRAAQPLGLHFAPDPSSQSAASIGGNIAENAGGPHCLRHGVTLQHVQGLDWVDAQGRALVTGRPVAQERGFQLDALLCGSEGTLGVITAARLGLVPDPSAVATLLAFFPRLDEATGAVVTLLGAGAPAGGGGDGGPGHAGGGGKGVCLRFSHRCGGGHDLRTGRIGGRGGRRPPEGPGVVADYRSSRSAPGRQRSGAIGTVEMPQEGLRGRGPSGPQLRDHGCGGSPGPAALSGGTDPGDQGQAPGGNCHRFSRGGW